MTRRLTKAGDLPEAAFQEQVEQLAGFYGWRSYHTHDSRRSAPGFPDLVLVRDVELVFAELKGTKTRVTPQQEDWIKALDQVARGIWRLHDDLHQTVAGEIPAGEPCVDVYLWRPEDFDRIHDRLARGRKRQEPLGAL